MSDVINDEKPDWIVEVCAECGSQVTNMAGTCSDASHWLKSVIRIRVMARPLDQQKKSSEIERLFKKLNLGGWYGDA